MEKQVSSPHNFLQRSIIVIPVLFAVLVIVQINIDLEQVQKAEHKLLSGWPNQNEVAQYKAHCEKGPVSREERDSKTLYITKFDCAKENASIDLANALVRVHASLPEPPPPLKYL